MDVKFLSTAAVVWAGVHAGGAVAQGESQPGDTSSNPSSNQEEWRAPDLTGVNSDAAGGREVRFSIIVENDLNAWRAGADRDENYTQGTALVFGVEVPEFGDAFRDTLSAGAPEFERTALAATLRHLIFTPVDIGSTAPVFNDRPYAGVLTVGVAFQRRTDTQDEREEFGSFQVLDHLHIEAGAIGEASQADDIQTGWHDAFDLNPVNGWDNQVKDSFVFNVNARRDWRFREEWDGPGGGALGFDLIPSVGADLGNLWVRARSDVTVRFGYNLADDFGATRIDAIGAQLQRQRQHDIPFGAAVFGRVHGRYVLLDQTLDGHGDNNVPSVDINPFVGEIAFGFELSYLDNLRFTWQDRIFTEEFEQQRGIHRFTSISLTFSFEH